MTDQNLKCPKCGGEFELGGIPESGSTWNGGFAVWASKVTFFKRENSHMIKAYRCQKCGYLESYAK